MCGIIGSVGIGGGAWPSKASELLAHRGPDEAGTYHDAWSSVSLGVRRLSILDRAGGHQPMANEDKTTWVVFNGEIYNAPELRAQLMAQGCRFRSSHSDTEVLLHLYERKGAQMPEELNGMFAFVIYDRLRRCLFGARDRFGIKPFYYLQQAGRLAFASELKALLLLPGVERRIDLTSLFHYMSLLYVPGEASILHGIKRLAPAHAFTYDLVQQTMTIWPYWDLDVCPAEGGSEEEWVELIRVGLQHAICRWVLSDVPVGCSLSGGIDSSAIVGLLSEAGHTVKTYSLGFSGAQEQPWNELPLARQVARRWGTEHHELILEPGNLLEDLIKMVWYLDEPYGGGLPSWYVFKFMRQDVTVGLTGTGGDELFSNYGKPLLLERGVLERLGMGCRRMLGSHSRSITLVWRVVGPLVRTIPDRVIGPYRKKRLLELPTIVHSSLMRYYLNTWYYFSDAVKREAVLQMEATDGLPDTATFLEQLYEASRATTLRDGIAYVDIKTQLADEFLHMTDRFSMAHSLEARVPFLDHVFVERVFRIPAFLRTGGVSPKALLKKAMAPVLPPELLRAKKRGFVLPLALWLRTHLRPLAESLLSHERLSHQGLLHPEFFRRFVRPHLEGKADYACQIWAAIMFQLWHLVFIEERAMECPSFTWRDICSSRVP